MRLLSRIFFGPSLFSSSSSKHGKQGGVVMMVNSFIII